MRYFKQIGGSTVSRVIKLYFCNKCGLFVRVVFGVNRCGC